jgi:HSP20 family protein
MFVLPLAHSLPRRAFHPAWDRAVHRALAAAADVDAAQRPAMDVAESEAGYTLSFDLPGMTKEQVKVTIERDTVNVEAAPADAAAAEAGRVVHRERRAPRFARTVRLPTELNHAGSLARFENGVLTLTLAKQQPEGAKALAIA